MSLRDHPNRERTTGQFVRFTPQHYQRITAAAKYRHTSVTSFVNMAAMKMVDEVEKEIRADEEYRERKKLSKKAERESVKSSPVGMGIRQKLEAESAARAVEAQAAAEQAEMAASSQPQVVVNTVAQPGQETEVARFAAYVVSGPMWNRPERLREAVKILGATASTEEEKKKLADMLDVRIAALDAANKPKTPEGGIISMLKKELFG